LRAVPRHGNPADVLHDILNLITFRGSRLSTSGSTSRVRMGRKEIAVNIRVSRITSQGCLTLNSTIDAALRRFMKWIIRYSNPSFQQPYTIRKRWII